MKIFHYETLYLSGAVLCALINGDTDSLEEHEITEVEKLENKYEGFYVTYETIGDEEEYTECDVLGLYAGCYETRIWLQLIHHSDQVNYLPERFFYKVEETETPRTNNVSGYGSKIPTRYVLHCADGFKRRVYARCYSNVASLYIVVKGEVFYIQGELI